ncbi:hypothetical protein BUALT_Bualt19G0116500 [Buddleja alternifolia]|uniref:DUF7086 domain-containing protein n=1 Tax=Buddleja alternifolia TaxID=168488 RepID=A0AAV6WBH6_9LAMI|nr:hypothetical protein BUALT_Bualt19G0116500 [Buddleja alternifolia]
MDHWRNINGHNSPFQKIIDNNDDLTVEQNDADFLALTLSLGPYTTKQSPSPPPPSPPPSPPLKRQRLAYPLNVVTPPLIDDEPIENNNESLSGGAAAAGPSRQRRPRRNPSRSPREGKSDTVPIPFPWATDRRATVHSLDYLRSKQITAISGDVQCRKCDRHFKLEFDLHEKFFEIGRFVVENKASMCHRAAKEWQSPTLPNCRFCDQENCVRPIISEKKKSINWLFMLLGHMLGLCTLDQLKYFCKHTKNHRTGAKDRVLYLTYLALCKQLDPSGPFDP